MSSETPPRPGLPGDPEAPPGDRLPPAPWRAVESIPVFIVVLMLSALGAVGASAVTPRCDPGRPAAACGPRFALIALAGEIAFVIVVVLWVRLVDHAPLSALGAPRRPLRDVVAGLVAGGGLVGVGWVAGVIVLTVARLILGHPPEQPEQVPLYVGGTSFLWSSVVAVVVAPLGEETFFRGFLYRGLRRRLSVWPASIISGTLFALVHGSPVLILALLPVGVGLALVYERRQSLVASMAAHAMFNLIGILTISLAR